jgi:hypothetical protein
VVTLSEGRAAGLVVKVLDFPQKPLQLLVTPVVMPTGHWRESSEVVTTEEVEGLI